MEFGLYYHQHCLCVGLDKETLSSIDSKRNDEFLQHCPQTSICDQKGKLTKIHFDFLLVR